MVSPLAATPNPFRGIVVITAEMPSDPDEFAARLDASIAEWRDTGYEVAWVDIPITLASHVPIAVGRGFGYHHADGDGITATLTLIPGSFIPTYATHYVGAGGVVVNDRDELLVCVNAIVSTIGHPFTSFPRSPRAGREHRRFHRPRGLRGNRNRSRIPSPGLLPPLARISVWQIGYLFVFADLKR